MKFTFKKNADSSADSDGNIEQQLHPKSKSTGFFSKSKTSEDAPATSMKNKSKKNKKDTNDAPHRGGDAGVINVTTAAPASKMSAERLAQKARGDSLVHKADANEGVSSWFSFATKESSEKKDNQTVLLLKKAAGAYILAGCNDEAGKAYQRAADIYKYKLHNKVEASRCLTDAGEVLKKSNSAKSIKCYQEAVTLLVEAGKLNDVVSMGLQNQPTGESAASEKNGVKKTKSSKKANTKEMKSSKKASKKACIFKDSSKKASGGETQKMSGIFGSFAK